MKILLITALFAGICTSFSSADTFLDNAQKQWELDRQRDEAKDKQFELDRQRAELAKLQAELASLKAAQHLICKIC